MEDTPSAGQVDIKMPFWVKVHDGIERSGKNTRVAVRRTQIVQLEWIDGEPVISQIHFCPDPGVEVISQTSSDIPPGGVELAPRVANR